MEKSWAKVFSDEIFPAIDEERFRVLYSQNASRPNTPVNIIVGALIIKELFALSDDEIVENLMLDIHYQYPFLCYRFRSSISGEGVVKTRDLSKVYFDAFDDCSHYEPRCLSNLGLDYVI